jgi:hypothetical protein
MDSFHTCTTYFACEYTYKPLLISANIQAFFSPPAGIHNWQGQLSDIICSTQFAPSGASNKKLIRTKRQTINMVLNITYPYRSKRLYRVFQKELYNFESLYKFIQRTYTMF